ncbi:MAG TPA: AMP-binding protein [Candidatus Polarisedimenticolia bacterium]|nr:AMP-binding protein [Candidatus Polarisedimenticolia bacterium]
MAAAAAITTLADLPSEAARLLGRRPALFFHRRVWSFRDVDAEVARLRSALAAHIRPGDRVALHMENRPEYLFLYYAVAGAGGIVVPLNTFLAPEETRAILDDCGAAALLVSRESLAKIGPGLAGLPALRTILLVGGGAPPPEGERGAGPPVIALSASHSALLDRPAGSEAAAERTAVLIYTSGTTGAPKGVMLSHRGILANARACIEAVGVTRKDRVLLFLPMFHSFTETVCMVTPLMAGMSIVLCAKLDRAEIRKAIVGRRPTIVPGVPAVFAAMAQVKLGPVRRWLNPVRLYISGGAPLSIDTLRTFERVYRRPLCEGYGLSEAGPVVSLNRPGSPRREGSVGRPLPGVTVRVVDEDGRDVSTGATGEVCVQSESVMQGYFRRPQETAAALRGGLLHTGDIGRLDPEGCLHLVGRSKEMLIYRGMNVYPREIETVLEAHPAVKEAAVIGLPDPARGEVPYAFVVLHPGAAAADQELRRTCLEKLARYKVPRGIHVVEVLPRNAAGKVLKNDLKERAAALHPSG